VDIMATIAERKILEAMAKGEFDNLPGRGLPLELVDELAGVPAELRMAYKILKNAGFIPPEVELQRELLSLRELVEAAEDDGERRRLRRELEQRRIRLSLMLKRPLHLEAAPEYEERVLARLGGPGG
jgi:Domain of unknown function (DUF1992)